MNAIGVLLLIGATLAGLAVLIPPGAEKGKRLVIILLALGFTMLIAGIGATWIPILKG